MAMAMPCTVRQVGKHKVEPPARLVASQLFAGLVTLLRAGVALCIQRVCQHGIVALQGQQCRCPFSLPQ